MTYVYDVEVYPNYFLAVFKERNKKNYEYIDLYEDQKDTGALEAFVKDKKLLGFNNVGYDAQILEYIIRNPGCTAYDIKKFNDKLFQSKWPTYREEQLSTINLDFMAINNYGMMSAKSTSLKKIEFFLREKSIKDTPVHFNDNVSPAKVEVVKKYCKHDVDKTENFINHTKSLVAPRIHLTKVTGKNFMNATEPQMAKKWFAHKLAPVLGMSEYEFKKLRTYRDNIVIKDIILDNIKFKSPEFNNVKDIFEQITLVKGKDNKINLKGQIEFSHHYNGEEFDFGSGGLHQCTKPGVYDSTSDTMILDIDFTSYYPNLAIRNNFYPAHLGPSFLKLYNELFIERQTKYPKKTHPIINYLWKIFLNSTYGLSNSEYGSFYDAKYTAQTCINGQLMLAMLIEYLTYNKPDVNILQTNTDGVTLMFPRIHLDKIQTRLKKFEEYCEIGIETVEYDKMVITDVNNYLSRDIDGNVKSKGLYETHDEMLKALNMHKDPSANIIPMALKSYFLDGQDIITTINNHNDIHDFCFGKKGKSSFTWCLSDIDEEVVRSSFLDTRLIRYYCGGTTTLSKLWKIQGRRTKQTFTAVEATTPVTVCQTLRRSDIVRHYKSLGTSNNAFPNLDREWYITKCQEIIDNVEGII